MGLFPYSKAVSGIVCYIHFTQNLFHHFAICEAFEQLYCSWMQWPFELSHTSFFSLQLVSDDEGGSMKALPLTADTSALIEASQAVLEDYTDAIEYRRAPLNPDLHQSEPGDKSSTYTLTNVVPLITNFLALSWNPYLDIIRHRLNNFCHGNAFMVTGATVSGTTIRRDDRDRLEIPKHVWLAYCCPQFDHNSPYEVRFMFPGYGGYGLNDQTDHSVAEVPLKTLENFLKSQTDTDTDNDLTIFYKGCVSENTHKRKRELSSISE